MTLIEQQAARIAELTAALTEIKALKPQAIGDTGFQTGPLALFQAAQRIARAALLQPPQKGEG